MSSEAERHDYEPGTDRPHSMDSDPPCRICGRNRLGWPHS